MRDKLLNAKYKKLAQPAPDPPANRHLLLRKGPIKSVHNYQKVIYDHKDFRYLKIKRTYNRTIRIDCNSIYFYINNPHELIKLSKYSKHTRCLELHALLFSHKVSLNNLYNLVRKLHRLHSIELYFGIVYILQSDAEVRRIHQILTKIRANLSHLLVEIYLGTGANTILSRFVRSMVTALHSMNKLKSLRIQLPKLDSKLGTIFQQQEDPSDQNEDLVKLCQRKFQRLRRLENIHLPFLISHHPMLTSFTNKFSHLPNLKTLEVTSYDTPYGKFLAEDLKSVKSLNSLTIYHCLEPNDALDLLSELPLLTKFAIKDDWLFSKTLFPNIECENYQNINVQALSLDFPMEISDEDDAHLYASFIEMFINLKSLKMYICCEESINTFRPLTKVICSHVNVTSLTLGLFVRSGKVFGSVLKSMYSINRLETLSLTMKLSYRSTWEQTIDGSFKALEGFLYRNKGLKQCEMFWEKFTPRCVEYLMETMGNMHHLQLFKLAYLSQYRDHGQAHDQMVAALEKTFKRAKNFEKVIITTACPSHLYEGCEGRGRDIRRFVALNKMIKSFCFETVAHVWTPFSNDRLLFY